MTAKPTMPAARVLSAGRALLPELAPASVSEVGRMLTPTGWRSLTALAKGFHIETRLGGEPVGKLAFLAALFQTTVGW